MSVWHETLGVFDLETTGVDVRTSRVVSAHVGVIGADGAVLERRDWLADPGIDIPEQASAVHGITTDRARAEGRPAAQVVVEIIGSLRAVLDRGIPVVVYNAPYDLTLLRYEAERYGIPPLLEPTPIVDPLVLDKAVDRYRRGKRTLVAAAEHYGVPLDDAHDAGADAIAAGRVAQAIAKAFPGELTLDAAELHGRQITWCAEQTADFEDYMRRTRDSTFSASGTWPLRG